MKPKYYREDPPMADWIWKGMLWFIAAVLIITVAVKALPFLAIGLGVAVVGGIIYTISKGKRN